MCEHIHTTTVLFPVYVILHLGWVYDWNVMSEWPSHSPVVVALTSTLVLDSYISDIAADTAQSVHTVYVGTH